MEQNDIRTMLNYPDSALVAHAVQRANLTREEWEVVNLRDHEHETIERTAEMLYMSVDTVKRRQRSGEQKLDTCWSSLQWIHSIIKQ